MKKPFAAISRAVWVLSLVSLLTDVSSEMLYPVLPLYLKSIGFSVVLIGVLEGVAEATAGLSKGWFGKWSDVSGRRLPFVQLGYLFSAVSKPMMALWVWPLWVFWARTLDRLGKGIRTGARDALLSAAATPGTKGRVFGFHRAMDTLGAALGPALALLYLYYRPGDYRTLFFVAFLPGLLAVLFTRFLTEKKIKQTGRHARPVFFSFLKYIPAATPAYRRLLFGLLAFSLVNSSDVFLLLLLNHLDFSDTAMVGTYIFYNLVYALSSYPLGILADRIGLKKIYIFGLSLFALTYYTMAITREPSLLVAAFFIYGMYAAATQGISKAWISQVSAEEDMATAIGTYEGLRSIAALLASSFAGFIWFYFGPAFTFLFSAVTTTIIILYFFKIPFYAKK